MIKIASMGAFESSACEFYRGQGVFPWLKNEGIDFFTVNGFGWYQLMGVDIFFLRRPHTEQHVNVLKFVKSMKIPIWIDYDDDLSALDVSNPVAHMYMSPGVQNAIDACVAMADVVTVATPALEYNLKRMAKKVVIVPNAFNDYTHTLATEPSKKNTIVWRGSMTHDRDFAEIQDALIEVLKESKWEFVTMGHSMWGVADACPNQYTNFPMSDLIEYFDNIRKLQPAIVIVPLVDTRFNRAKSNIAWIEGTYAGASVIAPNLPEWDSEGVLRYDDAEEFAENLRLLIRSEIDRHSLFRKSVKHIQEKLLLSKVNEQRLEIAQGLIGGRI